jgi:lipoyl synthase
MNQRKPDWLRIPLPRGRGLTETRKILTRLSLNTVCEAAACPNMMECFGRRIATFMILGKVCTRNCRFCNVEGGEPEPVDRREPEHVAAAVLELGLRHVVVTSVTRDDLPDGGASHFARVIERLASLDVNVEVLIPDFQGDMLALSQVVEAVPDIINHNVETVPRLYSLVRPGALYTRSLDLLAKVKSMDPGIYTKSGIMLGLGESETEVVSVFRDLRAADCDILTIGQYLAPSAKHYPVAEYVHPNIFEKLRGAACDLGFLHVVSGPLVRSSYHADDFECFARNIARQK